MALGSFANLRPYQVAAAQPNQNPLDALIQGFQQGVDIEQLPQTIQQDALNKQLQQEIAMAKLNQLQNGEIQNVGGNLVRYNPATGQAEVIFKSESPVNSQFVGFTKAGEPVAFNPRGNSLSVLPAPQGVDLTGGLQPKITPAETFQTVDSDQGLLRTGSRSSTATPLTVDGVQATRTKPAKSSGLTANRQNLILQQYGKVQDIVGPLTDQKVLDDQGQLDFGKLAIEVGSASRSQDLEDIRRKQEALPTGLKDEAAGWISAQKDLANLKAKLVDIKDEEPGAFQNAAAVVASIPSTGWFTSFGRQIANSVLDENTKDKETLRSGLKTAVQTALSGKAVTKNEEASLSALLPLADDTIKDLVRKSTGLEVFINNKLQGLEESGRPLPIQAPSTPPSSTGYKFRVIK